MAAQTDRDRFDPVMTDHSSSTRNCPPEALQGVEFARFVILSAPLRGKALELKPKPQHDRPIWSLGSGRDTDFALADSSLLPTHLYIEVYDGEWLVTCHPDCWGFYVNNEPVETAVIEHGDRLQIGRLDLVFVGSKPSVVLDEVPEEKTGRGWRRWFGAGA